MISKKVYLTSSVFEDFLHIYSLVRNSDGDWNVPYAIWNGSKWNRNANWLSNRWNSDYRVVLLVTFYLFPLVRCLHLFQHFYCLQRYFYGFVL